MSLVNRAPHYGHAYERDVVRLRLQPTLHVWLERIAVRATEPEHLHHFDLTGSRSRRLRRYQRVIVDARFPGATGQLLLWRQCCKSFQRRVTARLLGVVRSRLLRRGCLFGLTLRRRGGSAASVRRRFATLRSCCLVCSGSACRRGTLLIRRSARARADANSQQRGQCERTGHQITSQRSP